MPDEKNTSSETVGEMHKRREIMADGRRYLLYYTFGANEAAAQPEAKPVELEVTSETV